MSHHVEYISVYYANINYASNLFTAVSAVFLKPLSKYSGLLCTCLYNNHLPIPTSYLYILPTFMATVSLTSTDLSCPFSSKKTSLWPALFRSPSASALMWRVFPLSSSTWHQKKARKTNSFLHDFQKQDRFGWKIEINALKSDVTLINENHTLQRAIFNIKKHKNIGN